MHKTSISIWRLKSTRKKKFYKDYFECFPSIHQEWLLHAQENKGRVVFWQVVSTVIPSCPTRG